MVTKALMILMLIVSLSTLVWPSLRDVLSGVSELSHPWQPWTAVLVHGWPGMPMLLHLTGNLFLLGIVGPDVERWLGKNRFLTVTLLAIFAAGLVRLHLGIFAVPLAAHLYW